MRIRHSLTLVVVLLATATARADFVGFEDLFLKKDSFWNGSDLSGGFVSGGAFFYNDYNVQFQSWKGWAYSNKTDVQTPGFQNQYSAFALPKGGGDESATYGVAFNYQLGDAWVALPEGQYPVSARFTNTTYTAFTMLEGDAFSRKFGGKDGTTPDWFLLTIHGMDSDGNYTGSVEFYLADYRFEDDSLDYVVAEWTPVDLSGLGKARYLIFDLASSDTGMFGMNTPAYFAMDNLLVK